MSLETIQQRLRASLSGSSSFSDEDLAAAQKLAGELNPEGAWPDVDYASADPAMWKAVLHLDRVLALARARQYCSGELDGAITRALDFWLARDPQSPNWWQNRIGVPRRIGSIALLLEGALAPGARGKVVEILARAHWASWVPGEGWREFTGANLLWIAYNVVLRGCIEESPELCETAFARAFGQIHIAEIGEEGLQADMSFHQHGALLYSGGYGLSYSLDCAQFLLLAHRTPWQPPAETIALFAAYLLEGQQWMIRGRLFDYGARDREITREHRDLGDFASLLEQLIENSVLPRRAEMSAFVRRLRGGVESLRGHRHFWRSDFAVHQRALYYTSVRMSSRRTLTGECCNDEGKQSHHLADGLTYILRAGDEYQDLFPVWDWRRLPGITAAQNSGELDKRSVRRFGGGNFVGGVTDGEYGLAVMEFNVDGLRGRKAWFHFDESFVCLGTGIAGGRSDVPVFTSINQCRLRGPVVAYGKGGEMQELPPGRTYDLSGARRVEHDGVVYHLPGSMPACARIGAQSGSWAAIGAGSKEPVTRDVFSLWIDHGAAPRGESYAYAVVPVGNDADAARHAEHEIAQLEIITNSHALQAVQHRGSGIVGVVFREPGVINLPSGNRMAVTQPCVVLCEDRPGAGPRLSIANPTNEISTVHVEYSGKCVCFELSGGLKGGKSVTRAL